MSAQLAILRVPKPRTRPAPERADPRADRRRTGLVLATVCTVTLVVRLVYVWMPLRSDEGGYLLAARHWAPGTSEFIYGDYHVDRPPLLLTIFRLAAMWQDDAAIRVLAIPFVIVGVLAVARAGYLLAGPTGARSSAVVAAALMSSPALAGDQAVGGLFATVFVAGSVTAALAAWQSPRLPLVVCSGILAGALAAAATLVKQNFLDGFIFIGVLLLAHAARQGRLSSRTAVLAVSAALGAATAYALVAVWVLSVGIEPARIWTDLVEFRGEALSVILQGDPGAPATRAASLVALAVISAVVPIGWLWARWLHSRRTLAAPEHWALTAMAAYAVLSIAAGGSYWLPYLLQFVTPVALMAAVVAATPDRAGHLMGRLAQVAAVSALTCWAALTATYALTPSVWWPERVGEWLDASSPGTDTVFVAYGSPSIIESADLTSPYPYLWSLPMRTYDPYQERLRETLGGADAPAWVVQVNSLDSWDIDRGGRLRHLIETRYRPVGEVCDHVVYLRVDLDRELAPLPTC